MFPWLIVSGVVYQRDVPGPVAADPHQGPPTRAAHQPGGLHTQGHLRGGEPQPGMVRMDV